jgi:hypothetical protein
VSTSIAAISFTMSLCYIYPVSGLSVFFSGNSFLATFPKHFFDYNLYFLYCNLHFHTFTSTFYTFFTSDAQESLRHIPSPISK